MHKQTFLLEALAVTHRGFLNTPTAENIPDRMRVFSDPCFLVIDSIFNSVLLQKVRIRENLYAGIFYIVVLELNFLSFVVVGEKLEKKKKKKV